MRPRKMIASCLNHLHNPKEPHSNKSNKKRKMLEVVPLSENSKVPKFKKKPWRRVAAKKLMQSTRLSAVTAMDQRAINLIEDKNI